MWPRPQVAKIKELYKRPIMPSSHRYGDNNSQNVISSPFFIPITRAEVHSSNIKVIVPKQETVHSRSSQGGQTLL